MLEFLRHSQQNCRILTFCDKKWHISMFCDQKWEMILDQISKLCQPGREKQLPGFCIIPRMQRFFLKHPYQRSSSGEIFLRFKLQPSDWWDQKWNCMNQTGELGFNFPRLFRRVHLKEQIGTSCGWVLSTMDAKYIPEKK